MKENYSNIVNLSPKSITIQERHIGSKTNQVYDKQPSLEAKNANNKEFKNRIQKFKDGLKNRFIISKIEQIYLYIKEDKDKKKFLPRYYTYLKIISFLINFSSLMFLWILIFSTYKTRNNTYCLDTFSREFRICDQIEYCDNTHHGPSFMLFTDKSSVINMNVLEEVYNVNYHYLDFFLKDSMLFSLMNTKNDMFKEMDIYYSIVISITKNEKWNLFQCFNQYCNKTFTFMQIILICILTFVSGNYVLSFFGDVFGRKPVIIFSCGLQFLGSIIIFSITSSILDTTVLSNIISNDGKFFFNKNITDSKISQFLRSYDLSGLESSGLNEIYNSNFYSILSELITTRVINYNFSKFKFIFYLGIFCIYTPIPSLTNNLLAYFLENSLNDQKIHINFCLFNFAFPLSFLFSYILMFYTNSFHFPMLISGSLNFFLMIIFAIFCYESPRYWYEFGEYEKITKFFSTIYIPIINDENDVKEIESLYKDIDIKENDNQEMREKKLMWKREYDQGKSQFSLFNFICNNIMFLGFRKYKENDQKNLNKNELVRFKRNDLIKNPFFLFQIMLSNPNIKRNLFVLLALTVNIGLTFYLTINKLYSELILSRERLYDETNIIIDGAIFWLAMFMIFSIYVFDFLLKFFGFSMVIFISYPFIFLFSLMYELIMLGDEGFEDMNTYTFNSYLIIFKKKNSALKAIIFLLTFFAIGISSSLLMYLTYFSKTLYRCSFYGFFRFIIELSIFMSVGISQFFEKSLFYVSVLSIVGFINSYFIQEDFDSIIEDYRELEFIRSDEKTK